MLACATHMTQGHTKNRIYETKEYTFILDSSRASISFLGSSSSTE